MRGQPRTASAEMRLAPNHRRAYTSTNRPKNMNSQPDNNAHPDQQTNSAGSLVPVQVTRTRRSWPRLLGFAVAGYLLLWEFTQLAALPAVYRRVTASMPINASFSETDVAWKVKSGTSRPAYYSWATAYGPFVVRADYGWRSGPLRGGGGSTLDFWFFGLTLRIRVIEHWAA